MKKEKLTIADVRKHLNLTLKPNELVDNFGPIRLTDAVQYRIDKPIGITYFDKDDVLKKRDIDLEIFDQMYNLSGNYEPVVPQPTKRSPGRPPKKDSDTPVEKIKPVLPKVTQVNYEPSPMESTPTQNTGVINEKKEGVKTDKEMETAAVKQDTFCEKVNDSRSENLNYGIMVDPDYYYKIGNAFFLGADLTENQIKELYESDALEPCLIVPKSSIVYESSPVEKSFLKEQEKRVIKELDETLDQLLQCKQYPNGAKPDSAIGAALDPRTGMSVKELKKSPFTSMEDSWALSVMKELRDKTISIRRAEIFFKLYSKFKKYN